LRSPALVDRGGVSANRRNSPELFAIRSIKPTIGNLAACILRMVVGTTAFLTHRYARRPAPKALRDID